FSSPVNVEAREREVQMINRSLMKKETMMFTSHFRIQLHPALWFVPDDCIIIRNDEPIALTARETKLLRLLLETPGYLGASFLYQRLFRRKAYKSEPALREHCIEQIVSKLRRKLGEEPR